MRQLVDALIHVIAAVIMAAFLSEAAMRVVYARSLDFGMEMWKYGAHLKMPVPDPKRGFVHVPGGHEQLMGVDVQISRQGYRDREFSVDKPAGVFRILMLGDSTTFGWGAPLEGTVARSLERALAARGDGRSYEVINAGVGNYGTVQEVESYLEQGRRFHPDLVILQYFINDAEPVPRDASSFLNDHSYLRAFLASRIDGVLRLAGRRPGWEAYYHALYDERKPGWRAARRALHDLAVATRADGAHLLVAILPELHRINGATYPFTREHHLVEAVAAADGIPAIELIEALRDRGPESDLWVTPLDDHPNARAATLAAGMIARWTGEHALR